jgi:hypothetical protein
MIKYINNLLGYACNNQEKLFAGSDSEEVFRVNLIKQPNGWYYRNQEITYTYNEHGHRCQSLNSLDTSNLLLFTGCSHTEGIGLHLEKTYPYLVSQNLNCNYYNLAIGGTGIDILLYNLISYRQIIKTLPKILFVQWPEFTRFSIFEENNSISTRSISQNLSDNLINFIVAGDQEGYFRSKQVMAKKIINLLYPCKIIYIGYSTFEPNDVDIRLHPSDLARDQLHAGTESNLKLANELVALLR